KGGRSELRHEQSSRRCAELIIKREMIEQEIVQRRKVLPPRQKDADHHSREQPPFWPAFEHHEGQDTKKTDDRTDVNRPFRKRLCPPVGVTVGKLDTRVFRDVEILRH